MLLLGAAGGLSAMGIGTALDQDGEDGSLYGGTMALAEAFNVAGDLWVGPDSARSNVSADSGRMFFASDTQLTYYGDGGSWVSLGLGTSGNKRPASHFQSLTTDKANVGDDVSTRLPFSDKVWDPTFDSNNPLINSGNNSNDSGAEQYTPSVAYDGSTYHLLAKANSSSFSDTVFAYYTASTIAGFNGQSPDDAEAFTPSDSTLTIDGVREPALYYDGSTFHLFYRAEGNTDDDKIGHATTTDFSSWTDNGSVLTDSDFQTAFDLRIAPNNPSIYDVVKVGDQFRYYGVLRFNAHSETRYGLWVGTSTSIGSPSIHSLIARPDWIPRSGEQFFQPTVFFENGYWYLLFGIGTGATSADEVETYCLRGDGFDFDVMKGVVADTGQTNGPPNWLYGGELITDNEGRPIRNADDEVEFLFNGHDGNTGSWENGAIGRITFKEVPSQSLVPIDTEVFLFDGTETNFTNTSYQDFLPPRWNIGYGPAACAQLTALLEHQDSGETATVAVQFIDAQRNTISSANMEASKTGPNKEQVVSAVETIPGDAVYAWMERKVSGGSTGGNLEGAALRVWDKKIRETVR